MSIRHAIGSQFHEPVPIRKISLWNAVLLQSFLIIYINYYDEFYYYPHFSDPTTTVTVTFRRLDDSLERTHEHFASSALGVRLDICSNGRTDALPYHPHWVLLRRKYELVLFVFLVLIVLKYIVWFYRSVGSVRYICNLVSAVCVYVCVRVYVLSRVVEAIGTNDQQRHRPIRSEANHSCIWSASTKFAAASRTADEWNQALSRSYSHAESRSRLT